MSKELINSTKDFLAGRAWGASVAVTLNMKQGIRVERDKGDFYVPLTEERIKQNLRHFSNLLNRECFGNNWRRKGKRLPVFAIWERVSRDHIHLRIGTPFASPTTFDELKYHSSEVRRFHNLIRACWAASDFGYEKNRLSVYCDDGWIDYLAKRKSKKDYALSFLWENTYLPAKAS